MGFGKANGIPIYFRHEVGVESKCETFHLTLCELVCKNESIDALKEIGDVHFEKLMKQQNGLLPLFSLVP